MAYHQFLPVFNDLALCGNSSGDTNVPYSLPNLSILVPGNNLNSYDSPKKHILNYSLSFALKVILFRTVFLSKSFLYKPSESIHFSEFWHIHTHLTRPLAPQDPHKDTASYRNHSTKNDCSTLKTVKMRRIFPALFSFILFLYKTNGSYSKKARVWVGWYFQFW